MKRPPRRLVFDRNLSDDTYEWRPLPAAPDHYSISELGEVRRTGAGPGAMVGLVLSQSWSPVGRYEFSVYVGGIQRRQKTHRQVALAFIGEPGPGEEVRHMNGDAGDNRVANLQWGSHTENMRDMLRHGTHNLAFRTHCKHGHQFTAENTRIARSGARVCRTCSANRVREFRMRRRQR